MSRGHFHPSVCWRCNARARDGVHISQTGLCPDCSVARVAETFDALKAKEGRDFTRWRARLLASLADLPGQGG